MNKKLGLSMILNPEQFQYLVDSYKLNVEDKSVVPINKQAQLLMFYDQPVLFISHVTNIHSFGRIVNK